MSVIRPPSCTACGKTIAHLYDDYWNMRKSGKTESETLDSFPELQRQCCINAIITSIDTWEDQARYAPQNRVNSSLYFMHGNPDSPFIHGNRIATIRKELMKR